MFKLITCIAAEDRAADVVKGLQDKFHIQATVYHFARGFGRSSSTLGHAMGQQTEKMLLKVVVENKYVDDVFAYIYHTADLHRPHGGIIYVTSISKSDISPQVKTSNMEQAIHALE
ncbi:MAG: P-II family nitrogen regulator [Mariprofundaceae bacterium]|nr:P-II family nitrogen regulator [Mariprofundaceae bacterium]